MRNNMAVERTCDAGVISHAAPVSKHATFDSTSSNTNTKLDLKPHQIILLSFVYSHPPTYDVLYPLNGLGWGGGGGRRMVGLLEKRKISHLFLESNHISSVIKPVVWSLYHVSFPARNPVKCLLFSSCFYLDIDGTQVNSVTSTMNDPQSHHTAG
jgi:hypothetical protein